MDGLLNLTSLAGLHVSKYMIPSHNLIPNTSIQQKPLLHYHSVFPSKTSPSDIEGHLKSTGVVEPAWRYTMYSTSHFHSTTHEVLCISNGKAKLLFGGEGNPGKIEILVEHGDVLIVPAGVAHQLLEDFSSSGGFEMVGSYPRGKSWDMCYGKEGERDKIEKIKGLGWFDSDPLYGSKGPVLDV